MSTPEFNYLSYLILFVLVIYFLILFVFLIIRRYEVKARLRERPPTFHMHGYDDSSFTFDWTTRFEDVADCLYGRGYRIYLATYRVAAALFFFIYGIVICGSKDSQSFNYFDGWNVILLFLYFLAAGICSILLLRYANVRRSLEDDASVAASPEWSLTARFMAVSAHLLFEVSGCNTLLLLFGQAIGITSTSGLQVVTIVAIILLVLDLSVSQVKVRFDQFPASAAWLMLYLLILWPSVFTGSMTTWPYSFLDTGSSQCFGNYFLLFLASFICHSVFYLVFRTKQSLVSYCFYGRNGLHRDETRPMIELSDLNSHRSSSNNNSDRGGGPLASTRSLQQVEEEEGKGNHDQSMADSFYTLPDDENQSLHRSHSETSSPNNRRMVSQTGMTTTSRSYERY